MFKDFLTFEKMITPTIIRIVYYLGLIATLLAAIGLIISGITTRYGGGGQVFLGIMTLLSGPLLVRIYCEILIVAFQINNNLAEIKESLKNKTI